MIWGKRLIWLMVIIELINARPSYDIETGKTIKELKKWYFLYGYKWR